MKYNKLDLPTLKNFKETCTNHDWTFSYSDNHKVYQKGRKAEMAIHAVVKTGGEDYYNIWRASAKKRGLL